jgi:hypothetical protein
MKMSDKKYAKYIITENIRTEQPPAAMMKRFEEQRQAGNYTESTPLYNLNDKIIPGAMYVDCHWLYKTHGHQGIQAEIAHTHDFDEVLGFIGSNRENPRKLNGEIEFWLDDEQYIIDYSCLIFVPRGLKHLPLVFRRIDSPVFFFTAGNSASYSRSSGNE